MDDQLDEVLLELGNACDAGLLLVGALLLVSLLEGVAEDMDDEAGAGAGAGLLAMTCCRSMTLRA